VRGEVLPIACSVLASFRGPSEAVVHGYAQAQAGGFVGEKLVGMVVSAGARIGTVQGYQLELVGS